MADPEFLGLEDVPQSVADERWYFEQLHSANGDRPHVDAPAIAVESLGEFRRIEETTSEALIGTRDETILSADGILLMYGDGGAGKTTLAIDGAFHLAGARPWLGLEVARPVRSLVIENEGPRGKFRQTLNAKAETWSSSVDEEIHVLSEPWSRVTLAAPEHRAGIAEAANELEVDVIVLGPLATVGMVGGGTPDEVSAFESKLRELRALIARPVAFWIVHHENKAGDVSGAWERVPDTLVHVQAAGNGHTRLVFRKARWSSEFHGRSLNLTWQEGRTFEVVEEAGRDLWDETLEAFRSDDAWRTFHEVAKLVKCRPSEAKSVLAELVRRGDLMFEVGPAGRRPNAQCFRLRGLRLVEEDPTFDDL
jgi:AAA domain